MKKESILNEKERTYLENVLHPFKDKVVFIYKGYYNWGKDEYIYINLKNNKGIELPTFKKNSMYKGMEVGEEYTLKDLELFSGEDD